MPQKQVAVIMRRGPVGSNGPAEGIRAAMGLTAGTEENTVLCFLCDDAVFFALKGHDRGAAQKHLDAVAATGAQLFVDQRSLFERSLEARDVTAPFTLAGDEEIREAIEGADASLAF